MMHPPFSNEADAALALCLCAVGMLAHGSPHVGRVGYWTIDAPEYSITDDVMYASIRLVTTRGTRYQMTMVDNVFSCYFVSDDGNMFDEPVWTATVGVDATGIVETEMRLGEGYTALPMSSACLLMMLGEALNDNADAMRSVFFGK